MKRTFISILALISLYITSCNPATDATELLLSNNLIEVWFDQKEGSIEIKSDGAWSATSDSEWITITTPKGDAGVSTLTFLVAQNDSEQPREDLIMVTSDELNLSATLTVKQFPPRSDCMELHYTTNYNEALAIDTDSNIFNAAIVSHEFSNRKGVIKCNATITEIKDEAFYGATTLSNVTLPESLEHIGGWAFSNCTSLTNLTIPERVITIGTNAFAYCNKLQNLVIPNSVEEIGESAFCGCSGLSSISGKFSSADNRCLVIDNVLIQFAPRGISSYIIPSNITAIANDAFYESFSLRDVTIPASIKSIGDYAFYYCESLNSVYCKSTTPPTLGEGVFDNYGDTPIGCKIYVPATSVTQYKNAQNWSHYKSYIYSE